MNTNSRDAYFTRQLPDGRVIDVIPLTYGRARLHISENERILVYQDGW
jgi:hypothetical protein